jgi:integrase
VLTFRAATQAYFDLHEQQWKSRKHRAQFLSSLIMYAHPVIGDLLVSAVDTGAVLRCIEPIWHSKTETANRVRGRIEKVLTWCTVRGYRTGENPARWSGHLASALPAPGRVAAVVHHAALPYPELPAFMAELTTRPGIGARALEFVILTAARSGEVLGARWSEITDNTWTIPAARMKAGREHRVPLAPAALTLLAALPRESDFVFIGGRAGTGLSPMAMTTVLRRMGRNDATVHGFRSSFMDWAHERTAFAKVVIDMALAHTVGDKVEAAYRRGDLFEKRRQLMAMWASYCITPIVAGEVVPLRGVVS